MNLLKELKYFAKTIRNPQPKIFCIGKNKTGTTTLEKTLRLHGISFGKQTQAELLIDDYAQEKFQKIIRYCRTAQAFQDIPFSLPKTYKHLDQAFPNSKFILSVRDSDEQWYRSLVNFHTKKFSSTNAPPTKEDLLNAPYREPGFAWKVNRIIHQTSEQDLYNEVQLKASYNKYNSEVKAHFKNRTNLLVLNVAQPQDYLHLCQFLNLAPKLKTFPWENKTTKK